MIRITTSLILIISSLNLSAQAVTNDSTPGEGQVQSGPMLTYAEMREAMVWLQLKAPAKTYALYDDLETEEVENFRTNKVQTDPYYGNVAKLIFDQVLPGHRYRYRIFVRGEEIKFSYPLEFSTQPLWAYRTDPPAFSMALGSCTYISDSLYDRPGKAYGDKYFIFQSILEKDPDAMLWLGDNTYLRPADWWTRTGYLYRYTHTRSLPEMQELLASCNHFAIWDDHEFGPNDATGSWVKKELALEMFQLFWGNHTYGYPDLPGIMSAFTYIDVDFILLDNRWNRTGTYENGNEQIFGRKQANRLIDLLKYSKSPFKMVATGGQFLNTAKVYENHARYEDEREYILKRITEEDIKGVIFLSGDRHHSEIMEHELENGNKVWEFTVSPLTSGPNKNVNEENANHVEGTLIQQRNFAMLKVEGPFRKRVLSISFFDAEGKKLKDFSLKAEEIYNN